MKSNIDIYNKIIKARIDYINYDKIIDIIEQSGETYETVSNFVRIAVIKFINELYDIKNKSVLKINKR